MGSSARVIFSTGSLYLMDIVTCFELAAEAGFDGMEVMCDERWSTRDAGYLREVSARTGQPVLAIHTPFSSHLPGWPRRIDELGRVRESLALAESLAAEVLVVHLPVKVGRMTLQTSAGRMMLPWGRPFAGIQRWIDGDGLTADQQATSVKIALENMPQVAPRWWPNRWPSFVWWNTVEDWQDTHRHLTLDTTHWATLGIDPLEAYRAARERVAHVHLSNYNGREHRLPHDGDLDLAAFLRELAADNFAGTISLELNPGALHFTNTKRLRRDLQRSLEFCREHLN